MRNYPVQVLSGADTGTLMGSPIFSGGLCAAASFVSTFGDITATGTIKIQGSNDAPVGAPNQFVPTNFNDIPSATSAVVLGIGPAIVIPALNFQYIRAVYTASSGGSSTVVVNASLFMI